MEPSQIAKIFRAAAEGYMRPFRMYGSINSPREEDYLKASSMAGAFNAIAEIYEAIAKIDEAEATAPTPQS